MSERVRQWYEDRIAKGELSVSGWSRKYSQGIRWEANLRMMNTFLGIVDAFDVVDFGCGTAGFFFFARRRIRKYVGIEMRDAAREAAWKVLAPEAAVSFLYPGIPTAHSRVDVVVANAVYGFEEQDPVGDLVELRDVFAPRLMVVDFFSKLRPYEPTIDGYRAFDPFQFPALLCERMGTSRFAVDHSAMPHAFTVALSFEATPWEVQENGRSV